MLLHWLSITWHSPIIRPPGTIMFFYFLIRHRISELPWPIATKLCHAISISVDFIMQVQKIGGPPSPIKFRGPKHAKFGAILHHFRLWSRISPQRVKIFKISFIYSVCPVCNYLSCISACNGLLSWWIKSEPLDRERSTIPPAFGETSPVNFGPLTKKL